MEITAEHLREAQVLVSAAIAFRREVPWEFVSEAQGFAIRDPATGERFFASVRGMLGGPPGLGIHRGPAGYESLLRLAHTPLPSLDAREALAISGTFVELLPPEQLSRDLRLPLDALGLRFGPHELAPAFFTYLPDHVPGGPDGDERRLLTLALQQAVMLAPEVGEGRVSLASEGAGLLERRLFQRGDAEMWGSVRVRIAAPRPERREAAYVPDELTRAHLARLRPAHGLLWELDVALFHEVLELEPDERWPVIVRFLIVDRDSGAIIHQEAVPAPGRYEHIGRWFAEAAIELGERPAQLRVRDYRLRRSIAMVARAMGCKLVTTRYLDTTDAAIERLAAQIPPGTHIRLA